MPQTLARPPRKTRRKPVRIGPADHGRRMSLDDFDKAIGQAGYTYELNKGVIEVSGIPDLPHGEQVQEVRDQLTAHRLATPGSIRYIGGGSEAKMLIAAVESERHPDLSVYTSPAPAGVTGAEVWAVWVPAIVIEFVSPRSGTRDYEDKPDEYLASGVGEYWIVDAPAGRFTAMTRYRGQWRPKALKPSQKYVTHLLPGFTLDLKRVFAIG
jgi:Uma2 family endonuclease